MSSILLALQLALGLVPSIIDTVKAIETPGNGADKAATVINIVKTGISELAPDLQSKIGVDKLTSFVSKTIDIIVGFLNKVGVFKAS